MCLPCRRGHPRRNSSGGSCTAGGLACPWHLHRHCAGGGASARRGQVSTGPQAPTPSERWAPGTCTEYRAPTQTLCG
eukprot:1157639-Pelagomonas_calceolata.AAC.5